MTVLEGVNLNGTTVRLRIDAGRFSAIDPVTLPATSTIMLLPVEPHVHLDKTGTIARTQATKPGLFGAIEAIQTDKQHWTKDDLSRRMEAGMAEAYAAGVRAMRSHVDWSGTDTPLAWTVMGDIAQQWAGRLPLERASLTSLTELADPDVGPRIAKQVARDGGVLGVFVYRHGDEPEHLARVFDLAARHDLKLDFHVDEGLDPEARGLDAIVAQTAQSGFGGRVLCGHACSLSIRAPDDLARTAQAAAQAGVAITILPSANLYLQDMTEGRMPRLRGLAPAQELRAAGVEICLGTDNVRDPFVPFGVHDPAESLRLAWITGHLRPTDWINTITDAPARAMGLKPARIAVGEPADFLRLPAADLDLAFARPGVPRDVWRDGRLASATPETL